MSEDDGSVSYFRSETHRISLEVPPCVVSEIDYVLRDDRPISYRLSMNRDSSEELFQDLLALRNAVQEAIRRMSLEAGTPQQPVDYIIEDS